MSSLCVQNKSKNTQQQKNHQDFSQKVPKSQNRVKNCLLEIPRVKTGTKFCSWSLQEAGKLQNCFLETPRAKKGNFLISKNECEKATFSASKNEIEKEGSLKIEKSSTTLRLTRS